MFIPFSSSKFVLLSAITALGPTKIRGVDDRQEISPGTAEVAAAVRTQGQWM
jgi:hypothetical protein